MTDLRHCTLTRTAALLAAVLLLAGRAAGQITTAAIDGLVTDPGAGPLAGAVVAAVHTPSGTQYAAVTNGEGRYTIRGMRAGGPYRVEISFVGMEPVGGEIPSLALGEVFRYDAQLRESSQLLEKVVVTGRGGIDGRKTGAAAGISSEQIGRMPSITHGIADAIRLNPQVSVSNEGTIRFMGKNNRYNSFRIDGVTNNDVYGLADNGFNGGQAGTQPVSMEIVEQIRLAIAPFDVRQSGFTGGSIEAITKSGTNEMHGTLYAFANDQHLIGDTYRTADGTLSNRFTDQYEYRTGAALGGPLLKNRLFFFVNYERADKTYRNPYSIGTAASRIDADKAADLLRHLNGLAAAQGIDYRGDLDASDVYARSHKAGAKLDWNIGSRHKATLRWSLVDARQLNSVSEPDLLNASDFSYDFISRTNSLVAELQSSLTNDLSNELRVSYVRVRDRREPGAPFPMIQIRNVGDGVLNLGNDRSSMANRLDQDVWSFTDNLTWYTGKHALVVGTHNEFYRFSNLFIQDAYGSYFFDSPDDFYAGKIKQYRFAEANVGVTGDPRWASAFSAGMLGFYFQDNFNVSRNLDLTFGLRMDIPLIFDTPTENAPFNDFMARCGWPYRTDSRVSRRPLFAPRMGFRWRAGDRLVVRGGAGVFTGRIPYVWLSNNFANTGMQLSTYIASTPESTDGLSLILDPAQQYRNTARMAVCGSQIINIFDSDFRFPQDLRIDLAADFRLGGIRWTAEAVYSKTLNDVYYRNLAVAPTGETLGERFPSLAFDGRPLFGKLDGAADYAGIYLLCNTSRGHTYSLSLTAEREFDFGLEVMASYNYLDSRTQNNGTGTVAAANWQANYTSGNPNEPQTGYSPFNVPHHLRAAVYYTARWNAAHTTTFGLLYNGNSGIPYSVCYNGDLNGDGAYNDLIYIPTDAEVDQMRFTATSDYSARQQQENLKAWLAVDGYMKTHRGAYYRRNAGNKRFEHRFDLHLAHRFDFRIGKQKRGVELSFDIINLGNLLNRNWGHASVPSAYYNPITYKEDGSFQFLHDADFNMHASDDYYSRWHGQAGVKFIF